MEGEARGGPPASIQRRRLDWLIASPELFPGVAAVVVFMLWTAAQGGTFATGSYPGALFLLGLLAATAYAYRRDLPGLPSAAVVPLVLLAAFVVWNFLSIAWADDQGAAWDGANRCLLYLTVFALFVIPPWRPSAAAILLGLYTLALAGIGAVVLLKAAGSANPLEYFIADRFSEPTGYHNANAALFSAAIFPAIFLASRRETPWIARGVMLASAGVLFQLALLPQSRGWLIALPLATAAYFVVVPGRVRSLIVLAPLAAVAALTADPMLDVFDATTGPGALAPALDRAREAMLIGVAALLVAGALIGLVDRRLELPERTARLGSRVIGGLAAVAVLAGAIVAIGVIGNPVSWAGDRWDELKTGKFENDFEGSRLGGGLGSARYDFWRVALDEFQDSPVVGVGSENFAADYVRDRDSEEEPLHPHSLPLRVLSQTGLIGALLFVGFLVTALTAIGRIRLRSPTPLTRGIAGTVAVFFVYWFVHSTGDWFWAFPALTAPVFAWLGLGIRLDGSRAPVPKPDWARWARPAAVAAAAVGAVAAVSLALPWMAARDVQRASNIWPADPEEAFERLDRASDLNFLSAQPDLVEGAIATRVGDPERARAAFEDALERDPRNWYAMLELAAIDALEGDRKSALKRLAEVSDVNPRERLTGVVRKGLASGRPVSLSTLDAAFLERVCQRLGRVPGPTGCEPR